MSNEDKYDYYQIKSEFVNPLLDEYTSLREVMVNDTSETAKMLGATGIITRRSIGRTRITDFSFAKDCKFDFKYSSQKIDEELIIKPYRNSKAGKAFYEKMSYEIKRLDETYKGKIVIGDWLIDKFNCYREAFIGFNFLSSYAGADSKKELILLKIPKTKNAFNPPNEFKKITYGTFYDLVNC